MVLSETEKLILQAEGRNYTTFRDKLLYVNTHLGTLDQAGNVIRTKHGTPVQGHISKSKYYRMLGAISRVDAARAEQVAQKQLHELLNLEAEMKKQLSDTLAEITIAKAGGQLGAVAMLRKFWFDHVAYHTALKEQISLFIDRGGLKYATENDLLTVNSIR